jgi:hypothetical protein
MANPFIPEGLIPLTLGNPRLGNSAVTEWLNVSQALMCWLDIYQTTVAATATAIVVNKAYAAAGTGVTPITVACPIWAGTAVAGAALTLTRQTDAVNFTTAATAGVWRVIFQIDPINMGWEATVPSLGEYKYLNCTIGGAVGDYTCATLWVLPRHQNANPASTSWIV